MAWNEIYRGYSEERELEADLSIGTSGATGTATVKYYIELVVEHDWLYDCSIFKTALYLNITSVSSPIKLYVGLGSKSSTYIGIDHPGTLGGIRGNSTNGYWMPDAFDSVTEIVPGSAYPNILLHSWDMSKDKYPHGYSHRFVDGKFPLDVSGTADIRLIDDYDNNSYSPVGKFDCTLSFEDENLIPIQEKGAQAITADSFTDESTNPTVSYSIYDTGTKKSTYSTDYIQNIQLVYKEYDYNYQDYPNLEYETISLQVGLSLDGNTLDVPYRDAPIDGSYTFNLTEAQLEALRIKAQGSSTVPIYYMFKTTRHLHYYEDPNKTTSVSDYAPYTQTFYTKIQRSFSVVGCNPTLNPTVKDIKPETLALTGDENTFIRYESMAEYAINAAASKHATIVSQSVTCGSKTISNLPNGVIDDVESGTFIFNVVDSRSMGASSSVFKNLVEYVKPTCYQKAEIEITGETGAIIKLKVSGNYFNGSFGAANNTLKLEVRRTDGDDNWGAWQTITVTPTFNGITYELEATFTGLDYGRAYIFQSRITDKLNVVESAQYIVTMKPVFDWSDTDFNFNVPVNIDAEELNMYGETIIRHSDSTNNTVLSASNGNIYVRPGGTDDTSGETIFYNNGSVKFNGTVTFADGTTGGGNPLSALGDYVIEAGSDSMGSNGTWYWRKWASGTAEAWGCRNFGNMAITTAWGNLYRSAIFTQDLPYNVFIRTPDAININIVHSNFGGWICKHEQTAPSADTTGSFIFVRPASATATPTNIGFYVVGEWK